MKSRVNFDSIAAILLTVLLSLAVCPVAAVGHNKGETWTYEVSTSVDVGVFVVDVLGNVTYEFEEERLFTLGAREYDVNVIRVDGELSGMRVLFGEPFLNATVTIEGLQYETAAGGGIVEEDLHWLIDSTMGFGSAFWATQYEWQDVVIYTPPYLSELKPDSVELGVEWSEVVNVNSTVTTWENGTFQGTSSHDLDLTYDIVVESATDSIITPAGMFDAIRIAVTDENGNYELRWWSDDVNAYVKVQSYYADDDAPRESMSLVSYEKGVAGSMLWVVVIGIAAASVAILVLATVLLRMSRAKGS